VPPGFYLMCCVLLVVGNSIIMQGVVVRGDLAAISIGRYSTIGKNSVLRPSYKRFKGFVGCYSMPFTPRVRLVRAYIHIHTQTYTHTHTHTHRHNICRCRHTQTPDIQTHRHIRTHTHTPTLHACGHTHTWTSSSPAQLPCRTHTVSYADGGSLLPLSSPACCVAILPTFRSRWGAS
jgi:hypothetical protein